MTFPTIEAAANHLGAHQAALVRQFQRLESDIGTQLFHRSTPTTPMHPTHRGKALLRALDQPHIRRHLDQSHNLQPTKSD
jgi:DNA-binding transcriptional LysR family regulator